jgi:SPP1 gp7 family putative phage head morphogenesis protein
MTTSVDPFGLPPEEAVQWFQQKGYKLAFDWRDTWAKEHARAFTVAKATQLDVLADLREAVDRAIKNGTTLATFRKELKPTLQAKGWWGEKEQVDPKTGEKKLVQLGSANRLRTIYETNLRQAQAAGRWERFERTKAARPYGRYVCLLDGRERPEHRAWHGTILPLDDPWWQTHAPPNGWGCRCKMMQLSDRDLERYGFKVSDEAPPSPMVAWLNERTGETLRVPKGIDPGFDYNPGTAPRAFNGVADKSIPLEPVQSFADLNLPRAKDITDRDKAPERWPVQSPERMRARFQELFGAETAEVADPQGVQVTFSSRFLEYLMGKQRDTKRASFMPSAKAAIERPHEIWMVPFRRRDGSVVMRKRYIAFFEGADELVVVDRGDDGYAAWNAYPIRGVDSQRKGYLLYTRGSK